MTDNTVSAFLNKHVRQTAQALMPTVKPLSELAATLLNASAGSIYLFNAPKSAPTPWISLNIESQEPVLPVEADFLATLWHNPTTIIQPPLYASPISVQNCLVGALVLQTKQNIKQADRHLKTLTHYLSISIENLYLAHCNQFVEANTDSIKDIVQASFAYLPNGIILLNEHHHIILANPAAQLIIPQLIKTDRHNAITHLGDYTLATVLNTAQIEIAVSNSPLTIYEVQAIALPVSSHLSGAIIVIRDMSAERAAQRRIEQQSRLAAVGQLAAGIAHDFNNSLTSIIGFAELLRFEPDMPETAQNDLARIVEQSEHSAYLIRQILDFSRQSLSAKKPLDLAPYIQENIIILKRLIPENFRIALEIDGYDYSVNADPTQLQQVLTNLAINARDAMPQGGVLQFKLYGLTITEHTTEKTPALIPGDWVAIAISDSGVGIEPDNQAKIFEPFFTTKDVGKGTGLGLPQVYGIIKQHQGEIEVESELGEGTTFTIYLPAITPSHKEKQVQARPNIVYGNGESIMVVEDDPGVLHVIRATLERLKYNVYPATNGSEALTLFKAHKSQIDLVITDITMPDMGGIELAQALLKLDSAVKIVAITGYPLQSSDKALLNQGIIDWVQKPLTLEQLSQTVNQSLNKASQI